MRGRKPKPSHLKLVQGDPGKRGVAGTEPKPEVKTIAPPAWLPDPAKTEWRRIMPELVRWGLMTVLDVGALAGYCAAYAQFRKAQMAINKKGAIYESQSRLGKMFRVRPEITVMNEALRQMRGFAAEFGLTPAARVRLKGAAQGDLFDPFPETPAKSGEATASSPWDEL